MKTWKFVALWALLVSGFVGLLLGITMGIPIVEAVGGCLVWVSFISVLLFIFVTPLVLRIIASRKMKMER